MAVIKLPETSGCLRISKWLEENWKKEQEESLKFMEFLEELLKRWPIKQS